MEQLLFSKLSCLMKLIFLLFTVNAVFSFCIFAAEDDLQSLFWRKETPFKIRFYIGKVVTQAEIYSNRSLTHPNTYGRSNKNFRHLWIYVQIKPQRNFLYKKNKILMMSAWRSIWIRDLFYVNGNLVKPNIKLKIRRYTYLLV